MPLCQYFLFWCKTPALCPIFMLEENQYMCENTIQKLFFGTKIRADYLE